MMSEPHKNVKVLVIVPAFNEERNLPSILNELKKLKEVHNIVPVGSFRRCKETVGDIDILSLVRYSECFF